MKIKVSKDKIKFDLIDYQGNVYDSHEYETSEELEIDIPMEANYGNVSIPLVPKVTKGSERFTINDGLYKYAIDERADEIGYNREKLGPLYPD